MTAEEKSELKAAIEKKINRLVEDIVHLKEQTKPIAPENSIGRVSRMDAINNKAVAEAGLRNAEAQKSALERALSDIEKPDFGKCANCGATIHPKRIVLVPESKLCISCAR